MLVKYLSLINACNVKVLQKQFIQTILSSGESEVTGQELGELAHSL